MSQNIFDGLIPEDLTWRHLSSIYTTPAWSAVKDFSIYNAGSRTINGADFAQLYLPPQISGAYTTGRPGDPVMYNWNDGGSVYDHMAMLVGIDYVGTYLDQRTGLTYTYNRYTDVVNSHSTDRYHMPWNHGWRIHADLKDDAREQAQAAGEVFSAIIINA